MTLPLKLAATIALLALAACADQSEEVVPLPIHQDLPMQKFG